MRFRRFAQTCAALGALALAATLAAPALAHDHHEPGTEDPGPPSGPGDVPAWRADRHHGYGGMDPRMREEWLTDCRRRISSRDDGVGGAVIGGLVGGVAGNRIAGRGNRTVGTIAGAAVGAAAGMAIDKAEDSGRARDECEDYLDRYYAQGGYGNGYHGYQGYGYPAHGYMTYGIPMMMVPVSRPAAQPECREEVTYEYVDVPVRRRAPRRVPDKRVRVVPDKRIQTN